MALYRVDLHTHTTASDGMQPPAQNVRLAKEAGLAGVAITDHDTVAGIEEAMLEGERIGITVVPGVEISTVAEGQDIHILGYYMDWLDPRFLERLSSLRNTRYIRNELIINKLNELGIPISIEEVLAVAQAVRKDESQQAGTVGRPHIAEVLVQKGIVQSMKEAFDRYLATGAAAYVNPPRIQPFEAIDWIHEAGGACIVAHPGLYRNDSLVEKLIRYGADGIEVHHSDHSPEETLKYEEMARNYKVIMAGGSDFHGVRQGQLFHGAIGGRSVDISVLEKLKR